MNSIGVFPNLFKPYKNDFWFFIGLRVVTYPNYYMGVCFIRYFKEKTNPILGIYGDNRQITMFDCNFKASINPSEFEFKFRTKLNYFYFYLSNEINPITVNDIRITNFEILLKRRI